MFSGTFIRTTFSFNADFYETFSITTLKQLKAGLPWISDADTRYYEL